MATEGREKELDTEAEEAKKLMDEATAKVEAVKHKETVALEKLKAARAQKASAMHGVQEAKESRGDMIKTPGVVWCCVVRCGVVRNLYSEEKAAHMIWTFQL